MLEGWYCRTLANQQAGAAAEEQNVDVDGETGSEDSTSARKVEGVENANKSNNNESNGGQVDYKSQYLYLKKKLRFLIYENEFFQDVLRSNQRRLLKVSRDRAFLLDRLLHYEKPDETSDSEATESSEDEGNKEAKKRKTDAAANNSNPVSSGRGRKRKVNANEGPPPKSVIVEKAAAELQTSSNIQQQHIQLQQQPQGHMTPAEVERHLQSRQSVLELMPQHASATVPTEMFSNEPSLDGDPHDQLIDGSPTHVAAEECVQMEYAN